VSPHTPPPPPFALVQDGRRFLLFQAPLAELVARDAAGARAALAEADAALAAGRFVAGFLAYEAAAAFGFATRAPDPDGPPLAWLGVFEAPREVDPPRVEPDAPMPPSGWEPALDAAGHAAALARIHEHIAGGDTYQVNFTFPLRAPLAEDPRALFARLLATQRPRHAALVDLGRFAVACASPELFFRLEEGLLTARPMKGTAARGITLDEDGAQAARLRESEKERAENLMIVDMLRNDLGQVAEVGSVEVPALFEVERYPTLLQMTSTVTARSRAPLSAVLAALFPCASVTGAPKKRTMEIVAATRSRHAAFTGIGGPGPPRAAPGVAIRTWWPTATVLATTAGSGVVAVRRGASTRSACSRRASWRRRLHRRDLGCCRRGRRRPTATSPARDLGRYFSFRSTCAIEEALAASAGFVGTAGPAAAPGDGRAVRPRRCRPPSRPCGGLGRAVDPASPSLPQDHAARDLR
jgi:para-aminobenzoate synthetase/4-amino-4-deoxychorismate lyase